MNAPMDIDSMTSARLDEIEALCAEAFPYHRINRRRLSAALLDAPGYDPALSLLARIDGRTVSFISAAMGTEPGVANLLLFATAESHRRRGIAASLYERVEQTVRARGVRQILIRYTPALPGVDLRYAAGTTMLLRRRFGPDQTFYSQAIGIDELPGDTDEREAILAAKGIVCRPATPADVPLLDGFQPPAPVTALSTGGYGEFAMHVAVVGGRVVGYAAGDGFRFGPMATAESWRNMGIGRTLFLRACRDIAAHGYREVFIGWPNFTYYARLFRARIVATVWHMRKDLAGDTPGRTTSS